MSEMTEVNHGMPSLNGTNPLPTTSEAFGDGSTTQIKTSIPLQEVSAAREEPLPAVAHTLPGDDQGTAAAASAAVDGDSSMLEPEPEISNTKIRGPGHESDIRGLNGSGLAGHSGQEERPSIEEGPSSRAIFDGAPSTGKFITS
jgi:hypothetical protein